eukprot:scaffold346_cov387-Prasinococcus_capsulatus_cf.AAC.7
MAPDQRTTVTQRAPRVRRSATALCMRRALLALPAAATRAGRESSCHQSPSTGCGFSPTGTFRHHRLGVQHFLPSARGQPVRCLHTRTPSCLRRHRTSCRRGRVGAAKCHHGAELERRLLDGNGGGTGGNGGSRRKRFGSGDGDDGSGGHGRPNDWTAILCIFSPLIVIVCAIQAAFPSDVAADENRPVSSLEEQLARQLQAAGGADSKVAIIIPVLNEAKTIRETLRALKLLQPGPHVVIVADAQSKDGTALLARREGAIVVSWCVAEFSGLVEAGPECLTACSQ